MVKNLPAVWETWVRLLGWEDPLEKGMATHSSVLAWRIPRPEEPGGLYSPWGRKVGRDWVTDTLPSPSLRCATPHPHLLMGFPVSPSYWMAFSSRLYHFKLTKQSSIDCVAWKQTFISSSSLLADLVSGEDPVPGHLLAVSSRGGERALVFASPLAGYQSHHGSPTLMSLSNSLPKTPPPDAITWGLGACKHSVQSTSSLPPFPPTFTTPLPARLQAEALHVEKTWFLPPCSTDSHRARW